MSKRILFFGNERLATGVTTTAPTLRGLLADGYEIPAVIVAQKDAGPSRGGARTLEVAELAAAYGIPVLAPNKLDAAELAGYGAEAGVLVAYGKVVPPTVIDSFPRGIINLHPSLLPKHRGPTPIESAILAGETESGVSLMQLAADLDAGPVYAQRPVQIHAGSPEATKELVATKLLTSGADLLLQNLPAILSGSLQAQPQNEAEATYDQRIAKQDGAMDWHKTAAQLERELRAYAGWPRSRAKLGSIEVIITAVTPLDSTGVPGAISTEANQLIVYCATGALRIDRLIPAGKKEMPAQAFLAGYQL